jgi:hypothetical protein
MTDSPPRIHHRHHAYPVNGRRVRHHIVHRGRLRSFDGGEEGEEPVEYEVAYEYYRPSTAALTGDSDWLTMCFLLWIVAIAVVILLLIPFGFLSTTPTHHKWGGSSTTTFIKTGSGDCCLKCTADDDDFVEAICESIEQCNEIDDIKARLDILEAAL